MSAEEGFIQITVKKCRQIGCGTAIAHEDAAWVKSAMSDHLADVHGIGTAPEAKDHRGCVFAECRFTTSGTSERTAKALREHFIEKHGIDPKNPRLPAEIRRGR